MSRISSIFPEKRRNADFELVQAFFDTETKIRIARALDSFGVDYIEVRLF